ncbi:MAG TPA: DUF378 domain-containing protein [Actinomycetota bacterium]|nr:DUF378 domain-containing protein [Actinomycetota bacterium]
MLGRRKGMTDRVADAGAAVKSGAAGTAKKLTTSKKPNKVDSLTAAALLLGFANWISVSLFNFDLVQAVAKKKSVPGRAAYGFLGVSALWASLRGARGVK